jgi:hypothetical protein
MDPHLGNEADPDRGTARTPMALWTACALLVLSVAVAYGIPFLGFWLSPLMILLIAIYLRGVLWPTATRSDAVRAGVLAVIGLWLPAVLTEASTRWLIMPLCGPMELVALVLPAATAVLVVAAGVTLSAVQRTPWFWVVAMWLAPWAHMAVFSVLSPEIVC